MTERLNRVEKTRTAPLHSDLIEDYAWQGMPADPYRYREAKSALPSWLFTVVGALIPVLLWLLGFTTIALIAVGVFVVVTLCGVVSKKFKVALHRGLARFSVFIGRMVTWLLLAPLFYLGFTAIRIFSNLAGLDPLRLKKESNPTFWEPSDVTARNVKSVTRMFCSEKLTPLSARTLVVAVAMIGLFLFTAGELTLRLFGYANPILYTQDPEVCYMPQPNQHVSSLRGDVKINNFSMRKTVDVSVEKPTNVYRILLLGDSTLYGGEYLKNEQTYASLLEADLNQGLPLGKSVEILPMGVNSWGPYQKLGYVKKFGTFSAEQTIFCMPVGDAYRYAFSLEHLPYARRKPLLGWEMVALQLSWRYRNRMQIPGGWHINETDEYFQKGVSVYHELTTLLQSQCKEVSYELLPQGLDGMREETSPLVRKELAMFRDGLADTQVAIAYPAGLFAGKGALGVVYHSDDDLAHLGALGHRLYADYLSQKIRQTSASFKQFSQQ